MSKNKGLGKLLLLTGFGALLMAACHKEPIPEPQPAPENDTTTVVPTDTIPTDTIPTDTITQWRTWVLDWDWSHDLDTNLINQYIADPSTKKIIFNLLPDGASTAFHPRNFHRRFNYMEKYWFHTVLNDNKRKKPELIGSGTIFVNRVGGLIFPTPKIMFLWVWQKLIAPEPYHLDLV